MSAKPGLLTDGNCHSGCVMLNVSCSALFDCHIALCMPKQVKYAGMAAGQMADVANCKDEEGRLVFSNRCGRIRLTGVVVRNRGIDWSRPDNVYWQHKVSTSCIPCLSSICCAVNGCKGCSCILDWM